MSKGEHIEKLDTLIELLQRISKDQIDHGAQHSIEHEYLRIIIKREEARRVFWTSVANRVVSGGLWSLVVAITGAMLFSIKEALKLS